MAPSMRRQAQTSGKKSGGFVYKPRSFDDMKKRAERTGGRFDSPFKQGFDTWRPKQGENIIRFLPPTWGEHDHYGYTIWMHGFIGADSSSYLCLKKMNGEACPICEAVQELKAAGEDEWKKMQAKEQLLAWILDRDEDELTPQLYQMSWTMDRDIVALCTDKRKGKVILIDDPDDGYDVRFSRSGTKLNTRYFGIAIDRDPSPIHESQKKQDVVLDYIIDNPIPDVLQFYDADHLEKVIAGEIDSSSKDDDEEDDRKGGKGGRTRSRRDEPDDEEKDDRVRPSRRRSSRDESPDEEENRPRRRSSRDEPPDEEDDRPRRRSSRDEPPDDEDDRPRARRGRDDDDANEERDPPRRRSSRDEPPDDEEEKPRRRPARDEPPDEEEERPRSRVRSRAEPDEEEDKPRRRSSRDEPPDDEEEEDRPRRRRSRD